MTHLTVGEVVIAIDYSKNIAHKEYHQWYGEWWLYQQSTMLPIVVLIRLPEHLHTECHQHIFISGDLVHDAAFANKCLHQVNIVFDLVNHKIFTLHSFDILLLFRLSLSMWKNIISQSFMCGLMELVINLKIDLVSGGY